MTTHYCLLKKFNNYFNRKIIKYESLEDYENHSEEFFIPTGTDGNALKFNFNPNDNVTTEIIVNDLEFYPDYFLLLDDGFNILERWFVLEQRRNAKGQWVYYLKRDVISDNFNNLLKAPIFVQKGMLPETDPFIFNSEGMDFNQIKKSETLLKDKSNTSWIVCYLAKSLNASTINLTLSSQEIIPDYVSLTEIANELNISESDLASALNIDPGDSNTLTVTEDLTLGYAIRDGILYYYYATYKFNTDFKNLISKNRTVSGITTELFDSASSNIYGYNYFENNIIQNSDELVSQMASLLSRSYYIPKEKADLVFNKYNGKVILYLGNYYTLSITAGATTSVTQNFIPESYPTWKFICQKSASETPNTSYQSSGDANLYLTDRAFSLNLTAYTPLTKTIKASIVTTRKVCQGQEFDIVAIPVSCNFVTSGGNVNQIGDIAQRLASALAIKEGTNIFDVQLLPYCPRPEMIVGTGNINLYDFNEGVDFSYIVENNGGVDTNVGAFIYLDKASFKNKIEYELKASEGFKIDSQCNFYRLVSPNYQGSFEFNVAKNGGKVNNFNVYCTYKPYTPFIKVTPDLNYMYGEDYNDNRGLICAGDFSLPRSSSAWEQYQLENKNYQNIFNREIQNLNFMQSIERRNAYINGFVSLLADTAKGGGAGAVAGGPYGAIAGAVIGGVTSGIGYAVDMDTLAKTQRETKQLAIDKYNYQLGNIKALPYTLTKVGAFDISSKIYPFLEYYTCSDKEKDALKSKIKYESMTVMRIGTIEEFKDFNGTKNYFKGELIRNDEIADDPHTLNAIYEELLKGVYI